MMRTVIMYQCMLLITRVSGGRWFSYRLLRSPGLSNDSATSADDCVSKCVSTSGCSAVSWRQSRGLCLKSMCNSLDLVANTGWNTYVVFDSPYVDGVDFPASQMEWMLTDSCGSSNLGASLGPKMNLYNVTYNSSTSIYAGNAPVFAGNQRSYGRTDTDTRINNPLQTTSLSLMFWVNFKAATATFTFLEYASASNRGFFFWIANGGFWYNWAGTNCAACYGTSYMWTPGLSSWYHVAYVYNLTKGETRTYLNGNVVAVVSTPAFTNQIVWNALYLGLSPADTSTGLNGRLFCLKIYAAAVTNTQIARASDSCATAKIRFSS